MYKILQYLQLINILSLIILAGCSLPDNSQSIEGIAIKTHTIIPKYKDYSHVMHETKYVKLLNNNTKWQQLNKAGIEIIYYRGLYTAVLSSDQFFLNEQLDPRQFARLNLLVMHLKQSHADKIHIAAFTDNHANNAYYTKLSEAQAYAIKSFLWSHGIAFDSMTSKGYASCYKVGNNHTILGSHYNRRIEIQWQEPQVYQ